MQKRLLFLLKTTIFWCLLFLSSRALFETYNFSNTGKLSIIEIILTFLHGFRLDLSMTSYFMLLYGLIITASVFVNPKYLIRPINYITYTLIFIILFIIVVDVELFRNWGYRMDATIFQYLRSPKTAMASTPIWVTLLFLLIWILISIFACKVYARYVSSNIANFSNIPWYNSFSIFLLTTLYVLPGRGTLTEWPIRVSTVFFSNNQFANQASINVAWNFMTSLTRMDKNHVKTQVIDLATANRIFKSLQADSDSTEILINTQKPNVVIIILESFTADAIEAFGGIAGITPQLNKLAKEGVAFTNFHATSFRSNVGLAAIMAGYPGQHDEAILLFPSKTQNLPSLAKNFLNVGYSTAFYYGGDSDFANLKSFIKSGGYSKLEDMFSFSKTESHNSWGIHDHVMFSHLIKEMDAENGSFFKVLYTLSSHEPFDVPGEPRVKGNDENAQFLNTIAYTDEALGKFFEEAKTKSWWKNTLFVLTADHSVRFINNYPMELPRRYAIPMVWVGGALKNEHLEITKIGTQQDIPATLLGQLGMNHSEYNFSNNMMNVKSKGRAFYIWHDGFGLINEKGSLAISLYNGKLLHAQGDTTNLSTEAKSTLQVYINDFNNKELSKHLTKN